MNFIDSYVKDKIKNDNKIRKKTIREIELFKIRIRYHYKSGDPLSMAANKALEEIKFNNR